MGRKRHEGGWREKEEARDVASGCYGTSTPNLVPQSNGSAVRRWNEFFSKEPAKGASRLRGGLPILARFQSLRLESAYAWLGPQPKRCGRNCAKRPPKLGTSGGGASA